jgi:hypothetical protein
MDEACGTHGKDEYFERNFRVSERTSSVDYRSEFLTTDPEVLGSIPGATILSEK